MLDSKGLDWVARGRRGGRVDCRRPSFRSQGIRSSRIHFTGVTHRPRGETGTDFIQCLGTTQACVWLRCRPVPDLSSSCMVVVSRELLDMFRSFAVALVITIPLVLLEGGATAGA